jgi:photosystem II stability/assembly factor-like uncharacterized protein
MANPGQPGGAKPGVRSRFAENGWPSRRRKYRPNQTPIFGMRTGVFVCRRVLLKEQQTVKQGAGMKFSATLLFALLLAISLTGVVVAGEGQEAGNPIGSSSYRLSLQAGEQPAGQAAPALVGRYGPALLERLLSRKTAGFVLDGATIVAATNGGIQRSADGGATWRGVAAPPAKPQIRGLAAHPASRSTIYAATDGGVFTSSDAGNTWTACGTAGLPAAALSVVSLAVDPARTVYAGSESGIFASSDCASWKALNRGLKTGATAVPVAIAVDPDAPERLYTALDRAGIFTSRDRGKTWAPAAVQPSNKRIRALAVNPDGARLFAATYGDGVFTSTDHGVTWSVCKNTGLASGNVGSLLLGTDGTLYAGTDRGVFMSRDGCAGWTTLLGGDPL